MLTTAATQVAFHSDSLSPRRVLLNTSASVMRYDSGGGMGFSGDGNDFFDPIEPTKPPARIPSPGDLFLNIDLKLSREAVLRVFVPTDRVQPSWVPSWRFGFAVKESTVIAVGHNESAKKQHQIEAEFRMSSHNIISLAQCCEKIELVDINGNQFTANITDNALYYNYNTQITELTRDDFAEDRYIHANMLPSTNHAVGVRGIQYEYQYVVVPSETDLSFENIVQFQVQRFDQNLYVITNSL